MIEFLCCTIVISLAVAFLLTLAKKWGWLEWLQVHAPSELLNRLFSCPFCCSWWLSIIICLILLAATGRWEFIIVPVCSTPISSRLV